MKKMFFISFFLASASTFCYGQELVFDPVLDGEIPLAASKVYGSYNNIILRQNAIELAQTATIVAVDKATQVQNKIYQGLEYVSKNVQNAWQIVECAQLLHAIIANEQAMLQEAKKNPIALAFALKDQEDIVTRATETYADIKTIILKQNNPKFLMDAGERVKLLNKVLDDLTLFDGITFQSYMVVRMVVLNGVLNSINPFQTMKNKDKAITYDILHNWKF